MLRFPTQSPCWERQDLTDNSTYASYLVRLVRLLKPLTATRRCSNVVRVKLTQYMTKVLMSLDLKLRIGPVSKQLHG